MEHGDPKCFTEAQNTTVEVASAPKGDDLKSKHDTSPWKLTPKNQNAVTIGGAGIENICTVFSFLHPSDFLAFMGTAQAFYGVGISAKRNLLITHLSINPLLPRLRGTYDPNLLLQLCVTGEMPTLAPFLLDVLKKETYRSQPLQTYPVVFATKCSPFYAFLPEAQKRIKKEEKIYDEFDEAAIVASSNFTKDEKIMLLHTTGDGFLYLVKESPIPEEISSLYCTWKNTQIQENVKSVRYLIIDANDAKLQEAAFLKYCRFHPQIMPIFVINQDTKNAKRLMSLHNKSQFIINVHDLEK